MQFQGSVGPGIDAYPLIAGIPSLIPQCNLTVVGASGLGIYTYFIVANYPLGQVISGPYTIYNAPNIFSGGNYVRLDWQPTPNATTYDILRFAGIVTSLAGITTNSEIATGLTVTTYNNTAGTIGGFTTNLIGSSQIDLAIENQTSAYARVYFNPIAGGPFELDLSTFANIIFPAGVIPATNPAGPNGAIQFNNAGIFGGNTDLIRDPITGQITIGATGILASAGLIQIGAATKVAGIHISGDGAFDVDGFGDAIQLWLDADNETPYSLAITNQTYNAAKPTLFGMNNTGRFFIGPEDDGGTEFRYTPTLNQWSFSAASLQVQEWISTLQNTAPADGSIGANELADWFDPTNGAAFAMFKGKQADGTVVSGGLGLIGGSTTISTGVGSVKMSTANLANNTAWIPIKYAGTTYYVPGWATNAP